MRLVGLRYYRCLHGGGGTIRNGIGCLTEVACVHQLSQALIHCSDVAIELDVGLYTAIRVQHHKIVEG